MNGNPNKKTIVFNYINKLKGIGLWVISINKKFESSKKKSALVILIIFIIFLFGFYSNIYNFFTSITKNDLSKIDNNAEGRFQKITANVLDGENSIKETITGKDCTELGDSIWISDNSIKMEKQYLLLKDNQAVGSLYFFKPFFDSFVLKFDFIPNGMEGINMTISVKDDLNNELGVTIGDGDYSSYRVIFKQAGKVIANDSSKLNPSISKNKEVKFQLETSQTANALSAHSFIVYSPVKKEDRTLPVNLFTKDIPYFSERSVHLNIGLQKSVLENQPNIRLINCVIHEKNF